MRVFDAHCDLLMKLFEDKHADFVQGIGDLQVTLPKLEAGNVCVQIFAIYIPEKVHPDMQFQAALAQVDLFHERVIRQAGLKHIKTHQDIATLQSGEIGAILALEGCDSIGNDLLKLQTLIRLGVRSVGLTWNFANLVADGVIEPRGAGLSLFGLEVVQVLSDAHIWCDVSHLSEKGFWEVLERTDYVVATHSNAKAIMPHVRNLTDDQFCALVRKNSVVGVNFVPYFLTSDVEAGINDILRHIDHFCSLGGQKHIGFGADFDGISVTPRGLSGPEDYVQLHLALLKYYKPSEVDDFLFGNFARIFRPIVGVE